MKAKLESAITLLAEKFTATTTPVEALQFSQSALNLAHVIATLREPK